MLPKPYSVLIYGNNFRLVEENKGGKDFYYLVGEVKLTAEYFPNNHPPISELKIPLTIGAYESLKDGIENIVGSRIDVLGNLELKFISPLSK